MLVFSCRLAAIGALALLPLGGCATQPAQAPAAANAPLSAADAGFMDQAARSGLAQVQAGELAEQRASRADVRAYAGRVVNGVSSANGGLAALAQEKHISIPTTPSGAQQQMLGQLGGLSGDAFDRTYLDQQVSLGQAAVTLYGNEARAGSDPDVKDFASRTLPVVAHDLADAQQLGGHAPGS